MNFAHTGIKYVLGTAIVATFALPASAQVLNDPLQGSTIGTRSGGTFVAGGWQVTNQYDSIYWHVPTLAHGAFEFNIKGIPGGINGCPGGAGFKNEISHMYDYTFNNSDNVYGGAYQSNPYKQFLRKQCESGKTDTMEIVWQVLPNYKEDDTGTLPWDVNTNYLFRCEWQNVGANATLKTYRNGALIWTQTVAGNWNPAGQSVRIAASTRQADEGAIVGSVYSNVKVYDLASPPTAPTIIAPNNGETVNTTAAYIQWTGDPHTTYQIQINAQNQPDTAIIYDSQQVTSDRSFAWTGTLPDNATYYVFVRLGNSSGWGPWSVNGRTFSVNTAFNPGGINYVKVKGNTLANNSGPFLGLGFTHFRALQRCKFDRNRYQNDLAYMASKGFNYQRALSMVAWSGVEIAPVTFNGCGTTVNGWSDYDQQLKDAIDIAYDSYGIKTELTIFADAQCVMPSDSTRMAHLDRVLADIVGREQKVVLLEVGNELFQNGLPDANDVRSKGQYLADRTPIPVALSSPADTSDPGIVAYYGGSAADIATVHLSRDTGTVEGGWLPVRDSYRTGLSGIAPMSSNEPIGPGSSVASETDPIKLCMAGVFAWTANLPSYVFHCKAGIQGFSNCCPPSGTEFFFSTTAGSDSYQNILPLLPKDLASWERNDGKAAASPFTNYSNGQADKWWPEVGGATSGCTRNIAALKGGEFVTCPIGILSGGLELAARRPMQITVYHPITGAVVANLAKATGEHFTLAQGPQAYVIKGIFTDVMNSSAEVSIDLGSPDVNNCMTLVTNADGNTTPTTIGGRSCRVNTSPSGPDFYFYFGICDAWAFQASKQEVYIIVDYYDSGTSTIGLNYDSNTGNDGNAIYKSGGSIALTNTNTWKSKTFHLTDAYFGNRQNAGADFRFGDVGNAFYLDNIKVTTQAPVPPIIAPVTPNPQTTYSALPYTQQLTLTQGSPSPTWSLTVAPAGATVNSSGLVTGWTPSAANFGNNTFTAQATNTEGTSTASWVVTVISRLDFDADGDVDQADFAFVQKCYSGDGFAYGSGCTNADRDGDGDVDVADFNAFLPCMAGSDVVPGC